jgi:uncharacterized membrane protein
MNNYFTFDQDDKKLWMGIAAFGGVAIILLSLFATTSPFYWVERLLITLFQMFLPGYVIVKLFLNNIQLTENLILDKFLVSLGISVATVQTLYFVSTYLRTYAFNVDEEAIPSNGIAIVVALLVIGGAFGVKFYQNKKKGIA